MPKTELKTTLLERVLIDLYEKEAFAFCKQISPNLTGEPDDELQKKINNYYSANTQESKGKLDEIFAEQNTLIASYHNVVNFLIKQKLVNQCKYGDYKPSIYSLSLTLKGMAVAKRALENKWEMDNKLSLKQISKQNVWLTAVIAFATFVNVLIALMIALNVI